MNSYLLISRFRISAIPKVFSRSPTRMGRMMLSVAAWTTAFRECASSEAASTSFLGLWLLSSNSFSWESFVSIGVMFIQHKEREIPGSVPGIPL